MFQEGVAKNSGQMERSHMTLEKLVAHVTRLEQVIGPILRPVSPSSGGSPGMDINPSASTLRMFNDGLEELAHRLEEIVERVDL